ncbi:bacteriocin immunity protein [Companilactobacillus musae]|uniref:bacteriocin immunity protein n=1 Tax=Companilactobacillus musae TaxID=1903258 RepID=UPI0013C359E4|nr:bacteriocin immunity protein [Companilactobacillus musae]
MSTEQKEHDVTKSKELIKSLYDLLIKRDDYQDNKGLQDITDVLQQVNKTIADNKYPERLISKLVSYIYSMGPAHKIYFPKEEESIINELGVIAQKAGNTGLYYASYDTKSEFF